MKSLGFSVSPPRWLLRGTLQKLVIAGKFLQEAWRPARRTGLFSAAGIQEQIQELMAERFRWGGN